jgi:hypothetical protein
MILDRVSLGEYLTLEDGDDEGLTLTNNEGARVWLSWRQLDSIVRLTSAYRMDGRISEGSA